MQGSATRASARPRDRLRRTNRGLDVGGGTVNGEMVGGAALERHTTSDTLERHNECGACVACCGSGEGGMQRALQRCAVLSVPRGRGQNGKDTTPDRCRSFLFLPSSCFLLECMVLYAVTQGTVHTGDRPSHTAASPLPGSHARPKSRRRGIDCRSAGINGAANTTQLSGDKTDAQRGDGGSGKQALAARAHVQRAAAATDYAREK